MIYAMSDIHGEYEKYIEMLGLIDFKGTDVLYVIGDVIDRGPEPVKILKDMMNRSNVFPIIGNHEFMAIEVLEDLLVEITSENSESHITATTINKILEWQQNGGDITLEQVKSLPNEERSFLLEYLKEFTTLEVVEVAGKIFVLVHAGFASFEPEKDIYDYEPIEVAFIRPDFNRSVFDKKNVYVVSGHTPTFCISGKNEIYQSNNNICIDCGAVFGGRLACIRLNDMKEFYV